MAKNAYFGTDTGNFGTGTAMYGCDYSFFQYPGMNAIAHCLVLASYKAKCQRIKS